MRYFITLSYNGKAYHGWQIQPNAISVQETLEQGLSLILKQPISIVGAGRTDTGVHASVMYAHFDFNDPIVTEHLVYKLNAYYPKDIAIRSIFKVKPNAHARFDAYSRTYHYKITTQKDVFDYDFKYLIKKDLNIEAMNTACDILKTYTDFECFSKVNTDVKTFLCDITEAFWTKEGHHLEFTITANRFLRNMVRAIVGTMVNIGLEKLSPEDLHHIIASKKRSNAGFSVPAHGLYLVDVLYPEHIREH